MDHITVPTPNLEKKSGSVVTLTGEIPYQALTTFRAKALEAVGKDIEIDGFRKGHIPENILVSRIGEMPILQEMAERALAHYYPLWVTELKLDIIGYPQISLTKLAKDNPLGFTLSVAVVPPVTLPDYTALAKTINADRESAEVTEEDITTQVADILRQKRAYERLQKKAGDAHDHVHSEECDHEHEEDTNPTDEPLPELTDEYVQTLGTPGQFKTVAEFREKIREHLTIEKAQDVTSRHRAKITDAIVEKSEMEMPQVLIDAEIEQMFAHMSDDLKRAQLTMEDYLSHIKKTKEDLKTEWTPSAMKRAKLQLVLNAIAEKEQIRPDQHLVDTEVKNLLGRYPDADESRVRVYVASLLTNEAVLKKLEEAA